MRKRNSLSRRLMRLGRKWSLPDSGGINVLRQRRIRLWRKLSMVFFLFVGCGSSEIKPVDIFPEDNCAQCRMAVSDERFASEIISDDGEALKFDDLGCMLKFRTKRNDVKIAGIFLKDYEAKKWISYERAVIVETDVETPMGSGKVAFADSMKAQEFQRQHPARATR